MLPYLSAGWSGNPDRQETIEIFRTAGGPVFDPLVASEVAAQVTLNNLLVPERLNRLEIQTPGRRRSSSAPADIVERLIERATPRRRRRTRRCSAGSAPRSSSLSPGCSATRRCRRPSRWRFRTGSRRLAGQLVRTGGGGAQSEWARGLGRLLGDREALAAALAEARRMPQIPPGMPIGGAEEDWPEREGAGRSGAKLYRRIDEQRVLQRLRGVGT